MTEAGREWNIPDSYIFDGARSRQGYQLNKMCHSLINSDNRAAFAADEDGYMARYGVTDEQRQAVKNRDWLRLIQLGGNIYFVMKIGAVVKHGLYTLGAQQRGETLDQFLRTRNVKGAV